MYGGTLYRKTGDLLWVNLTVTTFKVRKRIARIGNGRKYYGTQTLEVEKAALLAAEQRARSQLR